MLVHVTNASSRWIAQGALTLKAPAKTAALTGHQQRGGDADAIGDGAESLDALADDVHLRPGVDRVRVEEGLVALAMRLRPVKRS